MGFQVGHDVRFVATARSGKNGFAVLHAQIVRQLSHEHLLRKMNAVRFPLGSMCVRLGGLRGMLIGNGCNFCRTQVCGAEAFDFYL